MDHTDVIVVGAGIIGLACARELALRGLEVVVLESENTIGTGISSRHSEVIHAGIYYPQNSLKARFCVAGRDLLYAYCKERGIAHETTGKLIVATQDGHLPLLEKYLALGKANGAHDLELLPQQALQSLEPNVTGLGALLSPSTGIFDSHALMLSLLGDLQDSGGSIAFNAPFKRAIPRENGIIVETAGTKIRAAMLINCAGLSACAVARGIDKLPLECVPSSFYAKGHYFSYRGAAPFSRLIYPVPENGGLGIHATIDLGGQVKFGPDVEWVDAPDYSVAPERAAVFAARIQEYFPGLDPDRLSPAYAGIRPKIAGPGQEAADFMISGPDHHGIPGLVNLFGIESPGATASLALARHVANLLGG